MRLLLALIFCLLTLPAFAEAPADYHGRLAFTFGGTTTTFDHLPRFEDFPAAHAPRKVAKDIDFKSAQSARGFRTRLRAGLREGANFNGHYAVVIWGCGTGCQGSHIVDIETGKVIELFTTSQGVSFKKDSSLLVANMPSAALVDWSENCMLEADNPRFATLERGKINIIKKLDVSRVWKNKAPLPCADPAQ